VLSAAYTPRCIRMVCVGCKQRASAADGPISWLPGDVVQLCGPPVLLRWENQRMRSIIVVSFLRDRCILNERIAVYFAT